MGTAFDAASRYLRYPETITVPLVCQSGVPLPSALAAAPVVIAVRGLTESEAIAAGIAGRGAVIVTQMVTGGRAAQAGLRERDIIVGCNDTEVVNAAQLEAIVRGATPEQTLRLRVMREGQALEIVLTKRAELP
jgi:S1-C subfamily serine protease